MKKQLFDAFSTTDKQAWKAQAAKDLKGKPLEDLRWVTDLGFTVEPYYAQEDATDPRLADLHAAQSQQGWVNMPLILYTSESATNLQIHASITQGAEAICIDLSHADLSQLALAKLLNGIKLSETSVFFIIGESGGQLLSSLQRLIPYQMKGGLSHDPLADWMQTGQREANIFEKTADNIRQTANSPQFRALCIDGTVFHEAGANATQEIAFVLASATTYLDKLTELGLSVEQIGQKMYFNVAVGTQYFVEIAKLRALRYLWAVLQKQWGSSPQAAYIHAHNSFFYDAQATLNTNMLRATTEAMSATIGGCNALTIHPYDAVTGNRSDFSERIAANISTLLKEEAHLDKTADPAAGSYFIDNLTLQLADAAWAMFLEVESLGGIESAFQQNFIQQQIEKQYQNKLEELTNNKRILVGVNKFRFDETPLNSDKDSHPLPTSSSILPKRRLATSWETTTQ